MYSKKERKKEKQTDIVMKIKEGESFQGAVTNSCNCHLKFNKMRKDKGLSGLPVPRSLTAFASCEGC